MAAERQTEDTKPIPQDCDLVRRTRSGDTEAFGRLVLMYQHRLFTSVIHIVRSPADAEDIVQDAFLQAFAKLDTFRGGGTFYAWLYRIAVNLAIDRQRRRSRRWSLEQPRGLELHEPHALDACPWERLVREEDAGRIQQAFESLSEEHRAILVMRGIEGFDYETIGQILELNPGTVRSRLHRARMNLKQRLNDPSNAPSTNSIVP